MGAGCEQGTGTGGGKDLPQVSKPQTAQTLILGNHPAALKPFWMQGAETPLCPAWLKQEITHSRLQC